MILTLVLLVLTVITGGPTPKLKGIYRDSDQWKVEIHLTSQQAQVYGAYEGFRVYVGRFEDVNSAIEAHDAAITEIHGFEKSRSAGMLHFEYSSDNPPVLSEILHDRFTANFNTAVMKRMKPEDSNTTELRPSEPRMHIETSIKRPSTSKLVGVRRSGTQWQATITVNGATRTIGRYDTELAASIKHDEAALLLYKHKAKTNIKWGPGELEISAEVREKFKSEILDASPAETVPQTVKYIGVSSTANNKHKVRVVLSGKQRTVGTFQCPILAAHVYDRVVSTVKGVTAADKLNFSVAVMDIPKDVHAKIDEWKVEEERYSARTKSATNSNFNEGTDNLCNEPDANGMCNHCSDDPITTHDVGGTSGNQADFVDDGCSNGMHICSTGHVGGVTNVSTTVNACGHTRAESYGSAADSHGSARLPSPSPQHHDQFDGSGNMTVVTGRYDNEDRSGGDGEDDVFFDAIDGSDGGLSLENITYDDHCTIVAGSGKSNSGVSIGETHLTANQHNDAAGLLYPVTPDAAAAAANLDSMPRCSKLFQNFGCLKDIDKTQQRERVVLFLRPNVVSNLECIAHLMDMKHDVKNKAVAAIESLASGELLQDIRMHGYNAGFQSGKEACFDDVTQATKAVEECDLKTNAYGRRLKEKVASQFVTLSNAVWKKGWTWTKRYGLDESYLLKKVFSVSNQGHLRKDHNCHILDDSVVGASMNSRFKSAAVDRAKKIFKLSINFCSRQKWVHVMDVAHITVKMMKSLKLVLGDMIPGVTAIQAAKAACDHVCSAILGLKIYKVHDGCRLPIRSIIQSTLPAVITNNLEAFTTVGEDGKYHYCDSVRIVIGGDGFLSGKQQKAYTQFCLRYGQAGLEALWQTDQNHYTTLLYPGGDDPKCLAKYCQDLFSEMTQMLEGDFRVTVSIPKIIDSITEFEEHTFTVDLIVAADMKLQWQLLGCGGVNCELFCHHCSCKNTQRHKLYRIYSTQSGDTPSKVALLHDVCVDELYYANSGCHEAVMQLCTIDGDNLVPFLFHNTRAQLGIASESGPSHVCCTGKISHSKGSKYVAPHTCFAVGTSIRVPVQWPMDRETPNALLMVPHDKLPLCFLHCIVRIVEKLLMDVVQQAIKGTECNASLLNDNLKEHKIRWQLVPQKKGKTVDAVVKLEEFHDIKLGGVVARLMLKNVAISVAEGKECFFDGVVSDQRSASTKAIWALLYEINRVARKPIPSEGEIIRFTHDCFRFARYVVTYMEPFVFHGHYVHHLCHHAPVFMKRYKGLNLFMQEGLEMKHKVVNRWLRCTTGGGASGVTGGCRNEITTVMESMRRDIAYKHGECIDLEFMQQQPDVVDDDTLVHCKQQHSTAYKATIAKYVPMAQSEIMNKKHMETKSSRMLMGVEKQQRKTVEEVNWQRKAGSPMKCDDPLQGVVDHTPVKESGKRCAKHTPAVYPPVRKLYCVAADVTAGTGGMAANDSPFIATDDTTAPAADAGALAGEDPHTLIVDPGSGKHANGSQSGDQIQRKGHRVRQSNMQNIAAQKSATNRRKGRRGQKNLFSAL